VDFGRDFMEETNLGHVPMNLPNFIQFNSNQKINNVTRDKYREIQFFQ
jgi:hypothetical protein